MSGHVQVNLAVQDAQMKPRPVRNLTSGECRSTTFTSSILHLDIWARDMGPQFTEKSQGNCA